MDYNFFNCAFICYGLAILLTLFVGIIYATRKTIMPYHLQALETKWDDIPANFQYLLKALLNGGGYYGVALGVSLLIMLIYPFREGAEWAAYAIGVVGLLGAIPLTAIVYGVKKNTKGEPPLIVMFVVDALLLCGLLCSVFC